MVGLMKCPGIVALVMILLSGCGEPPGLIGIDNPEIPAESVPGAERHKIFLLSNRQPSGVPGQFNSGKRSDELNSSSLVVSVPPDHEIGQLDRPKILPPDPRSEFAVINPVRYQSTSQFRQQINAELASRPPDQRRVLVFIHGYNQSTSDSVLRLAQFVHDSEFKGVPILLDWTSANRATRYIYDMNSALVARPFILEVHKILEKTQAGSYEILAHSMGAFLLMEGLAYGAQNGSIKDDGGIGQIVLAAPDIDLDLFERQLSQVGSFSDQIFVLISDDDPMLKRTRRIAGGVPRVGATDAEELAKHDVVVIDLSDVDTSKSANHSKFASAPEIVRLLGEGLNSYDHGSGFDPFRDMLFDLPARIVME